MSPKMRRVQEVRRSSKFVRHKFRNEVMRDLEISYGNLVDLCELFDRNKPHASSLIAVEISNLIGEAGKHHSPILFRFHGAEKLCFLSTPSLFRATPDGIIASKFNLLVLESFRTRVSPHGVDIVRGSVPRCWEARRNDEWPRWRAMSFDKWWNEDVMISEMVGCFPNGSPKRRYSYSRKELIRAIRNARGAHSRGAIQEDEPPLNEANAFSMEFAYSGTLEAGQEIRQIVDILPSEACARQIAEELLQSINENNRAGLFD